VATPTPENGRCVAVEEGRGDEEGDKREEGREMR